MNAIKLKGYAETGFSSLEFEKRLGISSCGKTSKRSSRVLKELYGIYSF